MYFLFALHFFSHNSQTTFSLLGSVGFHREFQKRILSVFSHSVLHSPTLNSFYYFITLLYEILHSHYSFPTLNDFVATENSAIHKMRNKPKLMAFVATAHREHVLLTFLLYRFIVLRMYFIHISFV